MAKILIVEDDEDIVELLSANLENEKFQICTATQGEEALLLVGEVEPDLMILDIGLPPGISGHEVCRRLRQSKKSLLAHLPIIILTARNETEDRIKGLELGADDYIAKPFNIAELVVRVKGLLRRSKPQLVSTNLTYADIVMDTVQHRVKRGEREIPLGPIEYKLLEYFLRNISRVASRETLLDKVWGNGIYVDERTVDVHIGRLRSRLNRRDEVDHIRTVRGEGYSFGYQSF